MRKFLKRAAAVALAAAMMIPATGIGASAATTYTKVALSEDDVISYRLGDATSNASVGINIKGKSSDNTISDPDVWNLYALTEYNSDTALKSQLTDGDCTTASSGIQAKGLTTIKLAENVSKVVIYTVANGDKLIVGTSSETPSTAIKKTDVSTAQLYTARKACRLNENGLKKPYGFTTGNVTVSNAEYTITGFDSSDKYLTLYGNNDSAIKVAEVEQYIAKEAEEPSVNVTWTTAVSTNSDTIRFLAAYETDAAVTAASIALIDGDGAVTFSTTTDNAFYADITGITDATANYTAKPYVIINEKGYFAGAITATVDGEVTQ